MKSVKAYIHVQHKKGMDNFPKYLDYIPHTHDQISFSEEGTVYEVDYTLINYFECEYPVEVYVHVHTQGIDRDMHH